MNEQLLKIHGPGNCHICGKPRAAAGEAICSYPHGLVPQEEVAPGMFSWKEPSSSNGQSEDGQHCSGANSGSQDR